MTQSAKRRHEQMNLPLLPIRALPVVPGDRQKELTLALMELLIAAACETIDAPSHGGNDDASETHA